VASEIKMLRVIKRLRELNLIPVKATFLGAHAIPPEFKGNKEGYLQLIVNEMLPAIAEERLADYIDIFCEKGYFTPEDTIRVLEAGTKYGLKGKVHAEQMSHSKGIQTGVRCNAVSVDHLEFCSAEDILFLASSTTIPTILPGAAYFLSLPNPPARDMIAGGLPIAIASDYNPGSSPTGNMKLMMSIACVQYRMTPQEAFNAATINSAFAMNLQEEVGSITRGHRANFVLSSSAGSLDELAYAFGSFHMDKVFVNGHIF
jgi:imidazolonepropionase